ncbi:hypothetical protein BC938DRAFT_470915 [Jimgerdemannia flammicorona]|uniref:Major facilitator superfamily associated domain-containing protein n=1 Tax=Jimgerdemannia flammicorona TaxID=994334 RepID=A0A433Q936_9FUNG|nr:hypothetical protein BC938DRAFT_470915 [Jimgerdemannia flammicorona]
MTDSSSAQTSPIIPGIAFSALWGAGVVHADELAPPHLQATSQGVLAAMYAGLGAGLGSLLGGVLYEHWGAKNMFRVVIVITIFSLLTFLDTSTSYGLFGIWKRYWAWWERRKEATAEQWKEGISNGRVTEHGW